MIQHIQGYKNIRNIDMSCLVQILVCIQGGYQNHKCTKNKRIFYPQYYLYVNLLIVLLIYSIVFYLIFYILDFVFYLNHKIKNEKIIGYIAYCISLFLIFNTSLNEKFYDTRKSIDKIKPLYLKYNCDNLNNKLSDYEVWVLKNTHIFNCNFYYDFKLKKNILVN